MEESHISLLNCCPFENGLSCLFFVKLNRANFTASNSKILMCHLCSLQAKFLLSFFLGKLPRNWSGKHLLIWSSVVETVKGTFCLIVLLQSLDKQHAGTEIGFWLRALLVLLTKVHQFFQFLNWYIWCRVHFATHMMYALYFFLGTWQCKMCRIYYQSQKCYFLCWN